ncbi:unnamed protein product [Ostreobium quekettii]|uniref:Methyltransferase domain-containing protein n=1 Tax=Ostreobium quekettii TaxID=121088 RepID=A0A8S1IKU2_9CHLO|nr:unnamed protein product [Ostreobium quekettii]
MAAFDKTHAADYDNRFAELRPLVDALHLLIAAELADLPTDARVLCVGAGTGAELLPLAERFPSWRFTAVDPSGPMLEVCRRKAEESGVADRCEFHTGYLDSLLPSEPFDAATSILVSQFLLDPQERTRFFRAIAERLRPGGRLVNADLAASACAQSADDLMAFWMRVMSYGGQTEEQLENLRKGLKESVAVVPASQVADLIAAAGFKRPLPFYQTGLIHGWSGNAVALETIDLAIIAAVILVTVIVGLWSSRRAGDNPAEYFLSGRGMSGWMLGISLVATTFAADTPGLVTELVRTHGVAGNWAWWAFLLTGMLTVFLFARLWRRSGVTTDLEFYELRYHGGPARLLRMFRAAYLGVVFNVIVMAVVSVAAIKIGHVMLGLSTTEVLLYGGVTALVLSTLGGFRAVVWTDCVLFGVAMSGAVAAAYFALQHPEVGGLAQLFDHEEVAAKQRMLAAKSENHALGAVMLFNAVHYALRPWPWILVALASLVVYPELADLERAFPQLDPSKLGNDLAYPAMLTHAPAGWRGLILASLLSAYVSTISTHLNWGSSYVTNDFYKPLVGGSASDAQLVLVGRLATVAMMVLASGLAYYLQTAKQGFDLLLSVGAGTGLVFVLRWYWWRINAVSEIVAMVASVAVAALFQFVDFGLEGWQVLGLSVAATSAVWLGATLLTRPEPDTTLFSFCRLIHPRGPGWRAVYRRAAQAGHPIPTDPQDSIPLGLLRMLLGTVAIYAALFAVGQGLYGATTPAIVLTITALAAGLGLGVTFRTTRCLAYQPACLLRGVTLLELLVVLGVLAILVALTLPAIQSSREAVRRTHCANNLRQTLQAVQAVHDAEAALPSLYNRAGLAYPLREWDLFHLHSWRTPLLPHLDEAPLHDAIAWEQLATAEENANVAQSVVPSFVCPSGGSPARVGWGRKHDRLGVPREDLNDDDRYYVVRADYDAMAGIQVLPDPLPQGADADDVRFVRWGVWGWPVFEKPKTSGAQLLRYRRGRFRDVTDGLSHTLAVVERGGKPIHLLHGRPHLTKDNPSADYPGQVGWSASNSFAWSINDNDVGVNHSNATGIYALHPGGASVALADGAVRFLADSTDFGTLVALFGRSDGGIPTED